MPLIPCLISPFAVAQYGQLKIGFLQFQATNSPPVYHRANGSLGPQTGIADSPAEAYIKSCSCVCGAPDPEATSSICGQGPKFYTAFTQRRSPTTAFTVARIKRSFRARLVSARGSRSLGANSGDGKSVLEMYSDPFVLCLPFV